MPRHPNYIPHGVIPAVCCPSTTMSRSTNRASDRRQHGAGTMREYPANKRDKAPAQIRIDVFHPSKYYYPFSLLVSLFLGSRTIGYVWFGSVE
jgi:hypothetical protein